MNWKAYKKWATLSTVTAVAMCVVSCSNESQNRGSPATKSTVYGEDMANLGAKYKGRQFMPLGVENKPMAVPNQGIVNQGDFLTQLSKVRSHSSTLTNRFAHNYSKITQWVASGGDVNDLAKFGIQPSVLRGKDGYQNVHMTGYYIPVIKGSVSRQGAYQHPIYAIPQGNRKYTRGQIYNGALAGHGLELAYTASMLDNFFMEVQGSGFIDIGNGQIRHLAYGNKNGYGYTGIGRLLKERGEINELSKEAIYDWARRNPSRLQSLLEENRSFVYFKYDPTLDVKGSAQVPLIGGASVASDRNIVPSGSVLLVEEPELDHNGNWTGSHTLRLMVALDVGGAVKGHHLDLYQGIGDKAGKKAGYLKHYGRVWILN